MRYKILLIDADKDMKVYLSDLFKGTDLSLLYSADGTNGIAKAKQSLPDLILLGLLLPDLSGPNICIILKNLSETQNTPIIMLLAENELKHREECLKKGAAGYIMKPVPGKELLLRINAVLRQYGRIRDTPVVLRRKDIAVDSLNRMIRVKGRLINPSPKEFALFFQLFKNRGKLLSRTHLLELIWGYDDTKSRTLDVHIRFLRQKLGREIGSRIITKHKVGYYFDY